MDRRYPVRIELHSKASARRRTVGNVRLDDVDASGLEVRSDVLSSEESLSKLREGKAQYSHQHASLS